MTEVKEINWFDTPDDRRKGLGAWADFMASILKAKKRREALEKLTEKENEPKRPN